MNKNSENISASDENILANSIRIARERISSKNEQTNNHCLEDNSHSHTQSYSYSKPKKEVTPAAQAIKALQLKISQMEAFHSTLAKENLTLKKELNLKDRQCKTVDEEVEIYRLRLEESQKKQKMMVEKIEKLEEQLKVQEEQLRVKEENFQKSTNVYSLSVEEERKAKQTLSSQIQKLNKRLENSQKIIVNLIHDLETEKQNNAQLSLKLSSHKIQFNTSSPHSNKEPSFQKNSKSKSRETITFPVIVDEPEEDCEVILTSNMKQRRDIPGVSREFIKKSMRNSKDRVNQSATFVESYSQPKSKSKKIKRNLDNGEATLKTLQQKNQELFSMLKISDGKLRDYEKMKNEFKNKFYALKASCDLIIQEIHKLPHNLQYKFKCLIVRVNKIEGEHVECLRSHSGHYRQRSNRLSSKGSSNGSRSKSKDKPLKVQDLNASSHYSRHSNSHSKQRLRISRDLSHSGKKVRKETISCVGIEKMLSKKIQEKRKQILEIHQKLADDSQSQESKEHLYHNLDEAIEQNSKLKEELDRHRKLLKM